MGTPTGSPTTRCRCRSRRCSDAELDQPHSLLEWLDELDAAAIPTPSAPVGDANVEASFDPLAHGLDESDPQFATRTII
jgi:hypothetical protein